MNLSGGEADGRVRLYLGTPAGYMKARICAQIFDCTTHSCQRFGAELLGFLRGAGLTLGQALIC